MKLSKISYKKIIVFVILCSLRFYFNRALAMFCGSNFGA